MCPWLQHIVYWYSKYCGGSFTGCFWCDDSFQFSMFVLASFLKLIAGSITIKNVKITAENPIHLYHQNDFKTIPNIRQTFWYFCSCSILNILKSIFYWLKRVFNMDYIVIYRRKLKNSQKSYMFCFRKKFTINNKICSIRMFQLYLLMNSNIFLYLKPEKIMYLSGT